MSNRIFFPTVMVKDKTQGNRVIEVTGDTIGNILSKMIAIYPEMDKVLLTNEKKLHGYIKVYVNDRLISSDILEQKIVDGDDIHFSFLMGGG